MADTVKISANLPKDAFDALKQLSEKKGVSMTEILRRAIGTEKLLSDTVDANGKVLIQEANNKVKQVLIR
jgi:hypothetical protein